MILFLTKIDNFLLQFPANFYYFQTHTIRICTELEYLYIFVNQANILSIYFSSNIIHSDIVTEIILNNGYGIAKTDGFQGIDHKLSKYVHHLIFIKFISI